MNAPSTESKIVLLARSLVRRTADGTISWTQTDKPTSFIYSAPHGAVQIESVDSVGNPPFAITLFNRDGMVVERLEMLGETSGQFDESLMELYEVARRNALNVDAVLDGILADLEDHRPPF